MRTSAVSSVMKMVQFNQPATRWLAGFLGKWCHVWSLVLMSTLSQIGLGEWKFMSLVEHKLHLCFHKLFLDTNNRSCCTWLLKWYFSEVALCEGFMRGSTPIYLCSYVSVEKSFHKPFLLLDLISFLSKVLWSQPHCYPLWLIPDIWHYQSLLQDYHWSDES